VCCCVVVLLSMGFLFGRPPPPPPPPPTQQELLLELVQDNPTASIVTGLSLLVLVFMSGLFRSSTPKPTALDIKVAEADARRRRFRQQITQLTFRALKAVAVADGVFHDNERHCLELCASSLSVRCPDFDELKPISPTALSKSLLGQDPIMCAKVLALMCHFAEVDGNAHPEEIKVVQTFADAFEIEPAVLADLRQSVAKAQRKAKDALSRSTRPELAKDGAAILRTSGDFFETLQSMCHR